MLRKESSHDSFRYDRRENGLLYKLLDETKDEFRLLSLAPNADPDSAITCRLFTANLAEVPSYTALSYVWGDPTITKPIFVNDIEVQVTVNLEAALRRIREVHETVIIWVDALCINQSDVYERNAQVTRMRELYSKARLVYAWLGEDTDGTVEAVFQHMSEVSSHFGSQIEEMDNFFEEVLEYVESHLGQKARKSIFESYRTGALSVSEALWEDIDHFVCRPYWQRIWIQQELLLPPKVLLLCGNTEFTAYYNAADSYVLWYKAKIAFTSNPGILQTYGWIIDTVKTVTPFDNSKDSLTANSIIAWTFLQNNIGTTNPAGISFLQAFCRNIFDFREQRDFLAPTSLLKIRSFLHWVLKMGAENHHPQHDSSVMSHPRYDDFLKQHGLENLFESLEPLPDKILLSLLFAKYTGAIDHLIEPYRGAKDHNSFLNMTAQQRMAAFWGCLKLSVEFLADVEWRVDIASYHDIPFKKQLSKLFEQSLIVTRQGYIGLATRDASVGDSICLVRGCDHPTVIRSFGQSYEVVGHSFIAGLMDNELFENKNLTEKNEQMLEFV
ncbi:heterokaryon incompatibility protein [Pyrenophora tritici-repentis]|nr:heterokaryon incompatibility protein [Pyrenophora tritici-repentis]KAI1569709.1 heterokaryon incompatibility protein [Pyrenophora tritici-repentis]